MLKNLLLRTQMNEIFVEIQNVGLEVSEFEWEDVRSRYVSEMAISKLMHKPSESYFQFDCNKSQEDIILRSPGENSGYEVKHTSTNSRNWPQVLQYCREWLQIVKRETRSPDLWSTAMLERTVLESDTSESENTFFSDQEKGAIECTLNEIKEYIIKTYTLTGERLEKVEAQFDYLNAAKDRTGRVDWKNIFVSTMVSVGLQIGANSSFIHEIFRLAGALFGPEFGVLPSP